MTPADEWDELRHDLATRRDSARSMGGPERLSARSGDNKPKCARARIDYFVDADSFFEIGALVGSESLPSDAFVTGVGTIDGGPIAVGAGGLHGRRWFHWVPGRPPSGTGLRSWHCARESRWFLCSRALAIVPPCLEILPPDAHPTICRPKRTHRERSLSQPPCWAPPRVTEP